MTEELNMSEQDLGSEDANLTQQSDLAPDASVLQNLPSSINLPAKPEAIDIYEKSVGNPLTGSNPMPTDPLKGNGSDIDAIMNKAFNKVNVQDNPYSTLRPYTYSGDYDASNFDRYYSAKDVYDKLGFNPYRNNEALYNNKMTFGDQFSRAAGQWDNLVASGFMSGVRSWGDMFTDPLAPDIKAAREMERYMAVGSSSTGGVGGFITNTFLNSGYSIGIGLEFLAEELALMGVTAVTGGLTSEFTAPLMVNRGIASAEKILKGGKAATKMDGVRAATSSLDGARSFWNTIGGKAVKGVFDVANPLDNTIKTLKATDYATDFASVSKTFGAFADDMLQIKQAVGEAKIEGGSTKLDVTEQLIQKYRDEHGGEDPNEEELTKINNIATQEAYKTALWNLPAIMTTNKLMNATILAPLRKVMGNETTKLVDDYIFGNKTFSAVGDGFLSRTKAAVKSLAKPKFYGQFGMNYLKANVAEGVQENLQEAIADGAVSHALDMYKDPIRANYEGFMGHFMQGVENQFSAQGAETFASGLLMGMFSQPILTLPSVGISKLIKAAQTGDKYKALQNLREEQDKKIVNHLNESYQDALKFFAPDIGNASRTGKLAKDMYTAARMGDKNETLNNRDAIANHHIITALRTGKFDIMMDRLKEYKNFNDKEIAEAFKKHGVEEQDVQKAAGMIDDVIARAESIRNNYEQIANKYPNPFNPSKFRDGTPEKKAAQIAKAAWDEATHNVLFAGATFESYSKRVEDISKTFSKISNSLAGTDAQSLMSLLSSQGTINEINALRKEVAALETLPEQRTLKEQKQKQLDAISNYYDAIASVKFARTDEEKIEAEKKAKKAFGEYVRVLGKKNDKIIFDEALEEAYTLTKDSLLLKNDMSGLAQSLNVLMTPDNFFNLHTRLNEAMTETFNNKVDILKFNQEQFRTFQDINGLVEEITKESGLYLSDELIATLAELKQKGVLLPQMPVFIDAQGQPVTSGPAYDKAKAIWDAYIKVARTGDIETVKSTFDPKALSTYPAGLVELLREEYNKLSDDVKNSIPFEQWAIADDQEKIRTRYFKYFNVTDFTTIDEKYKSMTLEELNDAISKLTDQLATPETEEEPLDKEEIESELRLVEDYLSYRLMMDVQMPESQKKALMEMKALTDAVENRTKENEKYVINGKKYDLRVTSFIHDVLLPRAPYNYKGTVFTEEYGKDITDLAKKIFEDNPNKSNTEKINEWVYKLQNNSSLYEKFINRFDEDKINLMKSEMTSKDGFDKFKTLIDKYAYEEAAKAGNTVDEITRLFLSGSPISKPASMSKEAFESLRSSLREMLSDIHKNGEIILAKNLVVTGTLEVDGETKTIAGEMDLLVVDKNGNLKIYDVKTGNESKWANYGIEDKDKFHYKDSYSLQLSMYKALIEQQTGLKITSLKVVPFEITKDLKGNIKTLKQNKEEKNVNHTFQSIVNGYVKKSVKRGQVSDPFVPVSQREKEERAAMPPTLLTPLTESEIRSRERNIKALDSKISTLQMKLDTLSNDAAGIEDTIEYLQNLLDNTVELTQANADQIKDQIDILLKSIKSSTASKTKRGERTIEAIESLKTSYRSEIQLLKDIHNRIADLKSELKTLKGVEKDINTQIDFYDGLIKNAKLRNLNITELKAKRKALQGKVNTIQKLIDGITNAIRKSVNYIKEYVKQVFSAENTLKKFSDETKFKPLSTKELKDLMDSDLEDDAVFLETYPKLKAEFDRLENDLIENLDKVEMTEELREAQEKRQEELVNALQKYQNQIRYLDELIESYKEVDINKRVRLPSGEFLYEVQQAPKPTVNNQTNKEDTEKTLARQKKEKKESTAKKNEEGIVVSVLKFVQEGPKEAEMTLEELNANLNLETLKLVKSKNYAILFNGVKYKIREIGKKSVTLYAPEKPDVDVKEAEISSVLEVVEKDEIKATQDEIDLIKSNNELVESTEKELSTTKETLDQLRDAFLNALC